MATISFTYDTASLTTLVNQIKEVTCDALVKEGMLKKEDRKIFKENYVIFLRQQGMISNLWEKVWGKPNDGSVQFEFVKTIGLWDREDGEKPEEPTEPEKNRFEKVTVE